MKEPARGELERIVKAHFQEESEQTQRLINQQLESLIDKFLERRRIGDLATDQLLNAIYLVSQDQSPKDQEKEDLIREVLKYLNRSEDE